MKEYKRRLIKFSNYSLCVTLPKVMLDKLELNKGDEVIIRMKRGKIIVEPNGIVNSDDKKVRSSGRDTWEPVPELSRENER